MRKLTNAVNKKILVPCVLMALSGNALSDEFDSMHKQLNIMTNIIKSSVSIDNEGKRSKINNIESTYLKGQGAVFTISSGSNSSRWGNFNFNFTMPELPVIPAVPRAPAAPHASTFTSNGFDIDIDSRVSEEIEHAMESYERAMDGLSNDRDSYRELRDEQRDLSHQVRDLERQKRDLEYQMRRADKVAKKELSEEMKALEKTRIEINKMRQKLSAKSTELRKEQQIQKSKQTKERQQYYQQLTATLAESFCLYGNGLKSIPKNEHVSLIIKAAGKKTGRSYSDKIYVFSKKDILSCAAENIDAKQLLAKGKGYQF